MPLRRIQQIFLVWAYLTWASCGRRLNSAIPHWEGTGTNLESLKLVDRPRNDKSAEVQQPKSIKQVISKSLSGSNEHMVFERGLLAFNPSAVSNLRSSGPHLATANFRVTSSQVADPRAAHVLPRQLQMSDADEASDADSMDWREMRARLVEQEKAWQQEEKGSTNDTEQDAGKAGADSGSGYAFASPLIEQGSVILGGTKQAFGFAMRQQYFHKVVMLLLQHDKFFTKGIILNRPTAHEIDGWRVWCGGDVCEGGMFRGTDNSVGDREIVCLHTLEGDVVDAMSTTIIKGVAYTDFDQAVELVGKGLAKQSDFWVFVGYAGWGPGQLQREVDRDSWFLASADSGTLLKELLRQGTESAPPSAGMVDNGISLWEALMTRIGNSEEVESNRGSLDDRMLDQWCRMRLIPSNLREKKETASTGSTGNFTISEGMVLRAGLLSDKGLLDDQFLHKSLILILGKLPQNLVLAVVLNRPTSDAVQLNVGKGQARFISFGGDRMIQFNPDLIDRNGMMWLGQSAKLKPLSIGTEIGNSGVQSVPITDAIDSLKEEKTDLNDFLLVRNLVVFTLVELERMLQKEEFSIIEDARPVLPQVFDLTCQSGPPTTGGESLSDGTSVWWAAGLLDKKVTNSELVADVSAGESAGEQDKVFTSQLPPVQRTDLADDMLAEWLTIFAGHVK